MKAQIVASFQDLEKLATLYQAAGFTVVRTFPLGIKAYNKEGEVKHIVRVRE